MASAAEQLAANLNFCAFAKARSSRSASGSRWARCVVYRLGTYIPMPGHRPRGARSRPSSSSQRHPGHVQHVRRRRRRAHGDLRAQHHAVHLGLDHRAADDGGRRRPRAAEEGRRAGPQDHQPVHPLRHGGARRRSSPTASPSASRAAGHAIVIDPGWFFRITTVITLTGGTMFLMWLGEQITARGIGNGISLIIFAGIVADLPSAVAGTLELGRAGRDVDRRHAGHRRAGGRRRSPSSSSWSAPSAGS